MDVNQNHTSETFLSVRLLFNNYLTLQLMILFHQRLPCSDNFFRYFKNYDRYMEEKKAEENQGVNPVAKTSESGTMESDNLGGNESTKSFHSQLSKSPVRTIESPKYGLQLSPI